MGRLWARCGHGARATLSLVAGSENAVTSREAAVEIVALHLFGIADREGALITRRMVDHHLAELASHPGDCRCAAPCGLVSKVTGNKVWWCAALWQPSVARTRLLAQR